MNEQQPPAMTEQEVARRLGLSVATLRAWRVRRRGPRYVRFGRAVRYLAPDIERFVRSCAVDVVTEPMAGQTVRDDEVTR
jgi:predicted DNA-binding transcriptional regulator AlpA